MCAERPSETHQDKLRSILAQLEFSHQVVEYDKAGVPFRTHIYEIHPITGSEYHEREDDAHVNKVIRLSLFRCHECIIICITIIIISDIVLCAVLFLSRELRLQLVYWWTNWFPVGKVC